MTLTAETASGFYYWFNANIYFRKYATDLREICRIGSLSGIGDCCEMELRSLKGRCHGNQFLFVHFTFFSSQRPVFNKLCVFSHDALDHHISVIHDADRRRFLLTTPVHRCTDIDPLGTDISFLDIPPTTFP